jgi:hypothetical protein
MGSLDDLQQAFGRLVRHLFGGLARLGDSRGQLVAYANATGTPVLPTATIARMKELSNREVNLQLLLDSVEVVEGVHDFIREANAIGQPGLTLTQQVELATDQVLRIFVPVLRWIAHEQDDRWLALVVDLFSLLDNRMGANNQGLTVGAFLQMLAAADQTLYQGQQRKLLLPQIALVLEFALQKITGYGKRYPQLLSAGWESPFLDREYGVPQPWRDTPTWIAQRTTSVRIVPQHKFTLDRYRAAAPAEEETFSTGITFVPVPAKRPWVGDPASAPPIANLGGPAVWIDVETEDDIDLDLSKNWSLHVRGFGDIGVEVALDGDIKDAAGDVGASLELRWTAPATTAPAQASATGGDHGGAAISVEKASITAFFGASNTAFSGAQYGVALRLTKFHLAITPSSPILGALVNRSLSLTTDLGLVLSDRGLAFEGGNGLDFYVATKLDLPFGLKLTYVRIAAIYDQKQIQVRVDNQEVDTQTTEIGVQFTAGIELSYRCITLILDGIGTKLVGQTNKPGGNLLGLGHLDADLVLPQGIGLRIDSDGVQGGGFFSYDASHERYSGAIELACGSTANGAKPKFVLRGVGFGERRAPLAGQGKGDVTVLCLFTGEFRKWGIGALVGSHRGIDLEAMRAAIPTGGLDALLFPQDVLGNAAPIVAALATMFPPAPAEADTHVIGLFAKLSWYGGLATLAFGLVGEFKGGITASPAWPSKVAMPFSLKVGKEGRLKSLFWFEMDGLGYYDGALEEWGVKAVLRNSHFLGAEAVGCVTIFYGDPLPDDDDHSKGFFGSAGGYHPSYYAGKGPGLASVDQRLGLSFARGDNLKLDVSFYFARSPAGWHAGLYGHLLVQAAGFGLEGKLWFDALFHSTDSWTIDAGGSVALILFGETITELKLEGEWTRTDKVRFAGRVSFKLLWWTVHKHTEAEMTDELATIEQATDVHAAIAKTVTDPESYPNAHPGDISLAKLARTGVWNAPEQPLAFLQKVAPLDTQIERIDASALSPAVTLVRGPVSIGGAVQQPAPSLSEFAPAAFLELDTDAALKAPLGELWPAGFTAGDEIAAGLDEPAAALIDEITIDRARKRPPAPPPPFVVSFQVLAAWTAPSGIPAPAPIRVKPARYAGAPGDAPTTFAKAWASRGTILRRTEGG